MPSIGVELTTHLKSVSAITDIVGATTAARIYRYEAKSKQSLTLPYVVYSATPGEVDVQFGGYAGAAENRIEITAFASTESAAYDLAELIRLNITKGTWGTTRVMGIIPDSSYEFGFDPAVAGGHERRYWVQADYLVKFSQTVS